MKLGYVDGVSSESKAIYRVLDEDLDDQRIEDIFFNTDDPWVEQAAIRAREWLDGVIEEDDMY